MSNADRHTEKWFKLFNDHKLLLGFGSMMILTVCSIYFNMRLGQLNSNVNDWTWLIMPLSYSFLDIALLCISMALFAGVITGVLWFVSWLWFGFLLTLSLFACLSCIIALDAQQTATGDDFLRNQYNQELAVANQAVATWTRNVKLAVNHKTRHQETLDQKIKERDAITKKISKLNDDFVPASQVVFEKLQPFLPAWCDADVAKTISRLAFGIAMIITPLLLSGILMNATSQPRRPTNSSANDESEGVDKSMPGKQQPQSEPHLQYYDARSGQYRDIEDERSGIGGDRSDIEGDRSETKTVLFDVNSTAQPPRDRKTGLDRDVAQKIYDYLTTGDGTVSTSAVAKRFGVGKVLLADVYSAAAEDGFIERSGKHSNSPWRRVS